MVGRVYGRQAESPSLKFHSTARESPPTHPPPEFQNLWDSSPPRFHRETVDSIHSISTIRQVPTRLKSFESCFQSLHLLPPPTKFWPSRPSSLISCPGLWCHWLLMPRGGAATPLRRAAWLRHFDAASMLRCRCHTLFFFHAYYAMAYADSAPLLRWYCLRHDIAFHAFLLIAWRLFDTPIVRPRRQLEFDLFSAAYAIDVVAGCLLRQLDFLLIAAATYAISFDAWFFIFYFPLDVIDEYMSQPLRHHGLRLIGHFDAYVRWPCAGRFSCERAFSAGFAIAATGWLDERRLSFSADWYRFISQPKD